MKHDSLSDFAKRLNRARSHATPLDVEDAMGQKLDLESAYEIQKHCVEQQRSECVGWKVGATNERAQQAFGFSQPFYGRLLARWTNASPVALSAGRYFTPGLEPEFAFRLHSDLPPREVPYVDSEIRNAISELIPTIEVIDSRVAGWPQIPPSLLVADNGAHGSIILGAPVRDWQHISLPDHPVQLKLNGVIRESGRGANVLGDPIRSVTWLANHLNAYQHMLHREDIITTGSAAGVVWPKSGDTATAQFGELGEVRVSFED